MESESKETNPHQEKREILGTDRDQDKKPAIEGHSAVNPKGAPIWICGIWRCVKHGICWLIKTLQAVENLIIAAATVLLAIVAYLQWLTLQNTDTTLRDTLVYSERAFISVQADGLRNGMTQDHVPALGIFMSLENSGGTPTKDLTSKMVCEPSIQAAIEPWDLIKQHKIETTPISIGPKSRTIVQCSFTLDQIRQMSTGTLHGYILGEVTYYDRISSSVLHKTHYAYELFSPAVDPVSNIVSTVITNVGKHNCTDEECP